MEETGDRTRPIVLAGVALLVAAGIAAGALGCGGDDSTVTAGASPCKRAEEPLPRYVNFQSPQERVRKGEKLIARVQTSCGTFEIALDTKRAPKTVNSFVFLAEENSYDGLMIHRVVPGFVIQGGDPQGDGTGGPGYSVDEKPPANLAYTRGTVAMAKSAAEPPGRSGSQFFVVLAPDAGLPPEYALVGKVSKGMDVVDRIGEQGDPATEKPKQTILIEKLTIKRE
jgi:cyclophilin family peptidyl-prolyl cis-trans isomerase